jgi:hypothetical protein
MYGLMPSIVRADTMLDYRRGDAPAPLLPLLRLLRLVRPTKTLLSGTTDATVSPDARFLGRVARFNPGFSRLIQVVLLMMFMCHWVRPSCTTHDAHAHAHARRMHVAHVASIHAPARFHSSYVWLEVGVSAMKRVRVGAACVCVGRWVAYTGLSLRTSAAQA